jgi:hypothetical protein
MAVVGRALGKIFPNNQGSAKLTGFRFQRNLKSKKCSTPIDIGDKADSAFIEDRRADK